MNEEKRARVLSGLCSIPVRSQRNSLAINREDSTRNSFKSGRSSAAQSRDKIKSKEKPSVKNIVIDKIVGDTLSREKKRQQQRGKRNLTRASFELQVVIGKGGFGRVWRAVHKASGRPFALKEMSKALILSKRSVNSVMNEKQLLSDLRHPFLVNMQFAFQDRERLYLAMDLLTLGDLRTQLSRVRKFTQQQTKFFACCIIEALAYLHSRGVIHRDLKPQNLIFDQRGYLRLTDLGVARRIAPQNSVDSSGTPGYMAPQVLFRQNHSFPVDFFALGVIVYECMLGKRPFVGKSRQEIRDKIVARQIQLKRSDLPCNWSAEAADFVNRALARKPNQRLGSKGIGEVQSHSWLRQFPWQKMQSKSMAAPFSPVFRPQFSDQGQVTIDDQTADLVRENTILLRQDSVQQLFYGYQYSQ